MIVKNLMNQFIKEEDGGLVEYLILIAIAAVAAALMFPTLRKNLMAWFNQMVDNVTAGISGNTAGTTTSTTNSTTSITGW